MKNKIIAILLILLTLLAVSCPVNPDPPSVPDSPSVVEPGDISEPTSDVEGEVEGQDITNWGSTLKFFVSDSDNSNSVERTGAMVIEENANDVSVKIDENETIKVNYNKGSYTEDTETTDNKMITIVNLSGTYADTNKTFKLEMNGTSTNSSTEEDPSSGSSSEFISGSYTKFNDGGTVYEYNADEMNDMGKLEGEKGKVANKISALMNGMSNYVSTKNKFKVSYKNFTKESVSSGVNYTNINGNKVIFSKGATGGSSNSTTRYYSDGDITLSIGDDNLTIRYDIQTVAGDPNKVTSSSYMQVKKSTDDKFKKFPIGQLGFTVDS